MSIDEVLEAFPGITREQVKAAVGFTRDLVAGKRNRLRGERKIAAESGAEPLVEGDPALT